MFLPWSRALIQETGSLCSCLIKLDRTWAACDPEQASGLHDLLAAVLAQNHLLRDQVARVKLVSGVLEEALLAAGASCLQSHALGVRRGLMPDLMLSLLPVRSCR